VQPHLAVNEFIQKYARRGILLDTNILLVYVLGGYDETRIESFKRTNTFSIKDYRFLAEFILHFRQLVVTPQILTEVSNLLAQLREPQKTPCFRSFGDRIQSLTEQVHPSSQIALTTTFNSLGMADASIPLAARNGFLVLTDDLQLYRHLADLGVDAINFNHIRVLGWSR
jgi:predicted nucleic acid-binding protein